MPLPVLQTPRLVLTPWQLDDIDRLHVLWIDANVRRYLWDDVLISRDRAAEMVQRGLDAESEGLGGWTVTERGRPGLAGFAALFRREPGDAPELLYGLAPASWGRGLATEAAREVVRYAFDDLGERRVWAATDPPNAASARVMERLGMRFVRRGAEHGL